MARRLQTAAGTSRTAHEATATSAGFPDDLSAVRTYWQDSGAFTEQSLHRMGEIAQRFADRLTVHDVASFAAACPADAIGFITAANASGTPPAVATQHARRTALRAVYRALRVTGRAHGDPTLDIVLPPRGELVARPLTDDEVTLARITAQVLPRKTSTAIRASAWALGEASAVSSEITTIRIADLDSPEVPRQVRLPGTRRHEPRTAPLTAWASTAITARVAQLREAGFGDDALIAYGGHAPPGGAKAQASVCNALRDTLAAAGLARERDIRPSSLRHWTARRAFDDGAPIEQVALLLGHRSLDETARDIGLHWRTRL